MDYNLLQRWPPERQGSTPLPTGRQLSWSEWGPDTGAPLVFFSGAATGCSLGFAEPLLAERGLRLIAFDRPGIGGSTHDPARSFASLAEDLRAFLNLRRLSYPHLISFSQGAPFALACAAPGVGSGITLVAASDELALPALQPLLSRELLPVLAQVRDDPAAAEQFFAGMTADTMRDLVLGMSSEADRAVYAHPAFLPAFEQALQAGLEPGGHGYARDTRLAMAPWPFDLSGITQPVALWYGARDASPVHSPDFGATLVKRLPRARRTVLPDAGGALLWTHSVQILASLSAAL